ncbi:hypothetical protein ACF5F1_004693 [Salmonella enterica]
MISSPTEFYVIKYHPDGEGVPYFMDKEWTPDLPDYDIHIKPPSLNDFVDQYHLKAKSYKLNGDYLLEDDLISFGFYELCEKFSVKCICIPVDISLMRGKAPEKKYFIFFNLSYLSILDQSKSIFTISKDIYDGKYHTPEDKGLDKVYYDKIHDFHVIEGIEEHLFFCSDIMRPVCSLSFKEEFERLSLTGIEFIPIDKNYRYDAWDGW